MVLVKLANFLAARKRVSLARTLYSKTFQGKGITLFFAPEAGVIPHYAALCVTAKTLQELGHPIALLRCFGIFERCPVMGLHRLPYDTSIAAKQQICQKCISHASQMLSVYNLPSIDLNAFYNQQITDELDSITCNLPDDLTQFKFDGIDFGKLCAIDLALTTKCYQLKSVSPEIRHGWIEHIRSSIRAYLLTQYLCQKLPVHRFVYFNDYSLMLGVRLAATRQGIPVTSLSQAYHRGVDRQRYTFSPIGNSAIYRKQVEVWPQWRNLSISKECIEEIADDLIDRLGSKSVFTYSPAKTFATDDLRKHLRLDPSRKLLVAYTSSYDEIIGARANLEALNPQESFGKWQQPFSNQIEWLQHLTDYVERSSHLQLVVRIHPREGKNKRDAVVSEHLRDLQQNFSIKSFRHCTFIWPEDQVSSYDLGEIADLALTYISSIGLELARLGVPVLGSHYEPGVSFFPKDDFIEWEATPTAYFKKLEALLIAPCHLSTILHAFRYYHLLFLGISLRLADVVPDRNFTGLPNFKLTSEAPAIEKILVGNHSILDINLQRLLNTQSTAFENEERVALSQQICRLIHFMYTGEDSRSVREIRVIEAEFSFSSQLNESPSSCVPQIFIHPSGHTHYVVEEAVRSKYSPLCTRLAHLYSHIAD